MINGSEKRNGWLNLELQSPLVIERRSKQTNKLLSNIVLYWSRLSQLLHREYFFL